MSKSLYKIRFIGREMLIKSFNKKRINVSFHERNTLLPYVFVNKQVEIHQGLRFKSYKYRHQQQGLKLGEFTKTRVNAHHRGKRFKISKKRPKIIKSIFTYDLKNDFFTR